MKPISAVTFLLSTMIGIKISFVKKLQVILEQSVINALIVVKVFHFINISITV